MILLLAAGVQIESDKEQGGSLPKLKEMWTLDDGSSLYAKFSERVEKDESVEVVFVEVETSKEIHLPITRLSDRDEEYLIRNLTGVENGRVVGIVDGDTFDLLTPAKSLLRIRIRGIDAPERGQDYYKASKKQLSDLIFNKEVTIEPEKTDRYDRIVAKARIEGSLEDVGLEMIKLGFAWHAEKYFKGDEYAAAQREAQANEIGLWAGIRAQDPEQFRNRKKIEPAVTENLRRERNWEFDDRLTYLRKVPTPPLNFERRPSQFQSIWTRKSPRILPTHWLNTNPNVKPQERKRHNRTCTRNFGKTKRGRFCAPTEGVACKICGG